MAQKTTNISEFLLEAPLETLHQESMEWLNTIDFWKDEITFFNHLLNGKTSLFPKLLSSIDGKAIENYLHNVSSDTLADIRLNVQAHEGYLAKLLSDDKLSQEAYRSKHKNVLQKMKAFEKELKEIKLKVFEIAKKQVHK
jgi:hypothetical protein